MSYIYPGNKREFYEEFGGLPDRSISQGTIFIIFLIVLAIIVIITALLFLRSSTQPVYLDRDDLYNLDTLEDINKPTTLCCVFPGTSAPNQQYVYDSINDITYSRQIPSNINTVCSSFPDSISCLEKNTDSDGNIIPVATYVAIPYYTFEKGLFIGCDSTTACI